MDTVFTETSYYIHFAIFIISMPLLMPRISRAYNYEINSIRLFSLAADHINESREGFTSRPYPANDHTYTKAINKTSINDNILNLNLNQKVNNKSKSMYDSGTININKVN